MELRLFQPKFTLTRTRKINYTCLLLIIIICIDVYVLDNKNSFISYLSIIICLGLSLVGSFYRINNLKKIKAYQGKFIGQIYLNNESITIKTSTTESFKIIEIEKISFKIISIKGMDDGRITSKFYYENGLYNGTENSLTITLKNGIIKKYNFEYTSENSFKNQKDLIEHYYQIRLIEYLEGVDLLGLDTKDEWKNFKKLRNDYNKKICQN